MSDALPNVPDGSGLVDRVVGKAKEVVGAMTGNDDLRDEGLLHKQKAEAEQAARDAAEAAGQASAEAELVAKEQELAAERERLVADAADAADRDRLQREQARGDAQLERVETSRRARVERTERVDMAGAASRDTTASAEHRDTLREADEVAEQAELSRRRAASLDSAESDREV